MPGSTLFLLVLLVIGALVSANGQQLLTRAPEDYIKQLKRGVLLKNKKLTSCELAPLDNGCSIVAASCLDYLPGTTTLDMSFEYEVLLDDGIDGAGARYAVENTTINPHFSLNNLANDIAILQYNSGSPITWQNRISPYSFHDWDAMIYSRAMITDIDNPDWSTALNVTESTPDWSTLSSAASTTGDRNCHNLSIVFDISHYDIACSPSLIAPPSISLSNCQIPMGVAYSIAHDTAFILGPYSYSQVVGGNSFCSYSYQRSYYTAIKSYLGYIAQVVGRDILVGDGIYQAKISDYLVDFYMYYPEGGAESPLNQIRLSGDFYSNQSSVASSEPASILDLSTPHDSSTTSNKFSAEESTSFSDIPITSSTIEIESSYSQTNIKCPTATSAVYSSQSKCAKK